MLRKLVLLLALVVCCLGAVTKFRRPRLDGRIVGGDGDGSIEEVPYTLSFEYGGSHICGAAIISEVWAVTAGHCVDGISASGASFRAGSSIRGSGGSIHPASEIILNPDYDYYTIDFDISVVKVSTPFTFGNAVQPIPLATSEPTAGEIGIISGWGVSSSGGSLPSGIQIIKFIIIDREQCNEDYYGMGGITANMICAGNEDICFEGSGGPLAVEGYLAGLLSWGFGCNNPQYPAIFTNVALLRSFVRENTGVD